MRNLHSRSAVAAVSVFAVALAACNGGGGATPTPAPTDSTPTQAATAAATPAPTTAGTTAPSSEPPAEATPTASVVDAAAARQAVCEAGEQEGALVYWSNFANPDPIMAAFKEAYPGIEVQLLSRHPDDHVQAALTEHTAGRELSADIIYAEINVMQPLADQGMINDTIDWRALGVPEDVIATEAHDVVRLYRVLGGLVYNTTVHTADDIPDTWEELIDEKWADQIVVDPRGRPFDQLSLTWGRDQTIDYVTRLAALRPQVIEGGTAGMVAVSSGVAAITTGGRSAETIEQQTAGAPVEIKYLDTITTLGTYNVVLNNIKHPNAAQCMVAWLATDGQAVHDEAEFKNNERIPPGAPEGVELLEVVTKDQAAQVAEIGSEIGRILTNT